MKLELTNKILRNDAYKKLLEQLHELESDRKFCKHDMEHFVSVARITLVLCSEKGVSIDPDIVYAAALLHDIASVHLAREILEEVGCADAMQGKILSLIGSHRSKDNAENSLESIFYIADKRSRLCFCCDAQDECNWYIDKRNMEIKV